MSEPVGMLRQAHHIRVDDTGRVEIVDPGFEHLPLLQAVDRRFAVKTAALPRFSGAPRFRSAMGSSIGMTATELSAASDHLLWDAHRDPHVQRAGVEVGVSLLDLKRELARRLLKKCSLCAARCGVDRTTRERGRCGLGTEAVVAEAFVHIAEEAPISPSLVLNLAGCGLRCRFCQQHALLSPGRVRGTSLDAGLWKQLDLGGARSISFVGGNPSESLHSCLAFLAEAPSAMQLPVVWNTHAYETPEVLSLLDGIVDAYVPDLKYMQDACAENLSRAPGYVAAATAAVRTMAEQGVPVFVRVLILPGHIECCHIPALEFLAALGADNVYVSIRGQYRPDWKISAGDGALARRPTVGEVCMVVDQARSLGLSIV